MLAGSGGLFLYQQQNQQRQRRRNLQRCILSAEEEIISEEHGASMSDDDSVVLDFRDDFSDACSISRYADLLSWSLFYLAHNTGTAVQESAALPAAVERRHHRTLCTATSWNSMEIPASAMMMCIRPC
jgi:hypothetical protein